MPSYIRPKAPGATIFFTVALAERGSDLLIRELPSLRAAFHRTLMESPFYFDAIVILPDHLHALLTLPHSDADYSQRWRKIKSRFSRSLPKGKLRPSHLKRQERGIWQRRFWEHHIRDVADYDEHLRYCWLNPVKHGLVDRASDWPYSSLQRDIQEGFAPADL